MKKLLNQSMRAVLALGLTLVLGVSTGQAAIVANFDGGEGSAQVDQYPGMAGDGWTTGWNATNSVVQVLSGSPINGGGNYLSVTPQIAATRGVNRTYTNFAEVDLTKTHVIRFDWRYSGTYANFDSLSDRLFIGDGSVASGGEGSSTAFNVRAHGAQRGSANAKEWAVYNGNQDGAGIGDQNRWVNTGMLMEHFVVYSFTITLKPETRTYDVSIDNGISTVTVENMGFNRSTFDVAGTLHFMANKSTGADNHTFGFDSVSISVPEPASIGVLGLGGILLASRRQRH